MIRWLELQELEYWSVSLTKDEGNTKVFDWIENETLEARKQRFRDTMRISQGGRYYIKAKRNKTDGRGIFLEEFSNLTNNLPASQSAIGTVTGITPDEVEKRIQDALSKDRQERELKELKEENQQLQKALKEVDTAGTRFMQKLEPYIGMIASSFVNKIIPAQPAVTMGMVEHIPADEMIEDNENDTEMNEQEQTQEATRIETALIKWAQADPDYINLLEAIAELAASKDNMYTMAKGFIKK
ncbi:MAG: hypothetical protein RBT49_09575 [Bacteroidales bacterium]|nr:hypothetical protein [Bacteroidales bacterium]